MTSKPVWRRHAPLRFPLPPPLPPRLLPFAHATRDILETLQESDSSQAPLGYVVVPHTGRDLLHPRVSLGDSAAARLSPGKSFPSISPGGYISRGRHFPRARERGFEREVPRTERRGCAAINGVRDCARTFNPA
jgi:hypothetical protein